MRELPRVLDNQLVLLPVILNDTFTIFDLATFECHHQRRVHQSEKLVFNGLDLRHSYDLVGLPVH